MKNIDKFGLNRIPAPAVDLNIPLVPSRYNPRLLYKYGSVLVNEVSVPVLNVTPCNVYIRFTCWNTTEIASVGSVTHVCEVPLVVQPVGQKD
jgi:hypothetical protein